MKKLKKLLALSLAMIMALSLCTVAFAAGTVATPLEGAAAEAQSITMPGELYTPTLKVSVTAGTKTYVNPYKTQILLEDVETPVNDTKDKVSYDITGLAIASEPIFIRSDSTDTKIDVMVSKALCVVMKDGAVTSGTEGVIKFVNTITASNPKEKEAKVYLVGKAIASTEDWADALTVSDIGYSTTAGTGVTAIPALTGGVGAKLEAAGGTKACTIEKATSGSSNSVTPSYAVVGITGELSNVAGYGADDAITSLIVFTFVPGT